MKKALFLFLFLPVCLNAQIITTLPSTDGTTAYPFFSLLGVIEDSTGKIYIVDEDRGEVKKRNTSGFVTTIAGTGVEAHGSPLDDGGPATAANIDDPTSVARDRVGNIYVTDVFDDVVRKIDNAGIITAFAGTYTISVSGMGYAGDGGPATAAILSGPTGIVFDMAGNLYIADDDNNVIRKVNTAGIISTVVGNGFGAGTLSGGYAGDGGPASAAELFAPEGIAFDLAGNLYIWDAGNNAIRRVSTSGIITTFAGGTGSGYSGDGGPATAAMLGDGGFGFAFDPAGNVYFSDPFNRRIRVVNTTGIINTYAGNGIGGYTGDGGLATLAECSAPEGMIMDKVGNLIFGDSYNEVLRKISGISGMTNICLGDTAVLQDAHTTGGAWYSSNSAIALLIGPGQVKGVSAGLATVFYVVGSDTASAPVLVSASPTAGVIMTADSICLHITTDTLIDTTAGGYWHKDGVDIPIYFFPATSGVDTVYYSIPYTCGIVSASKRITVVDADPCCISGRDTVCTGDTVMLTAGGVPGGTWGVEDSTFAAVLAPGEIKGIAPGEEFAIYTVNGGLPGCVLSSYFTLEVVTCDTTIVVSKAPEENTANEKTCIFPNPVTTELTIINSSNIKQVTICNLLGQTVYSDVYHSTQVQVNVANLTAGIYFVKINGTDVRKFLK